LNKIIFGDAIDLLKSLDSNSIDLIITDPPYGIGYHSNHYKDKNPHSPVLNDWDFDIGSFMVESSRVLKDGGALYLFTRYDVYPIWVKWVQNPIKFSNLIVWEKDNWSAGDLKGNFGNQYEMIMFMVKGRHLIRGYRYSNIWKFSRVSSKKMRSPTEKPVDLIKRIIESSSDKGNIVLDPFCGSGSVGEAARDLEREFILGDLDAKMIRVTSERLGMEVPEVNKNVTVPVCPIFNIEPPSISMWGLHPEDVLYIKGEE